MFFAFLFRSIILFVFTVQRGNAEAKEAACPAKTDLARAAVNI